MSFLALRARNDNVFLFLWRGLKVLINQFVTLCRASMTTTLILSFRAKRGILLMLP